jgi:hypothetical protein
MVIHVCDVFTKSNCSLLRGGGACLSVPELWRVCRGVTDTRAGVSDTRPGVWDVGGTVFVGLSFGKGRWREREARERETERVGDTRGYAPFALHTPIH